MDADEFAANWALEKSQLLQAWLDPDGTSHTGTLIRDLGLTQQQLEQLSAVLDAALTDAMYGLLLGLDGSASIGGDQQRYAIHDEKGRLVNDCGQLEAAAYRHFHEDS